MDWNHLAENRVHGWDLLNIKKNLGQGRCYWHSWRLLSLHVVRGQINKTWLWNILFYGNDGENKYTEENRTQCYFVRHKLIGVGSNLGLQRVDWSATKLLSHDTGWNPNFHKKMDFMKTRANIYFLKKTPSLWIASQTSGLSISFV